MQTTDETIILSARKYIQNKYIVQAITKHTGRITLIVYSAALKKMGMAFLSPLSYIEMTFSIMGRAMPNIKDFYWMEIPKNTQEDVRRRSIAVFIAEVLENAITHPMPEEKVFEFIVSYIQKIEHSDKISDLPIQFLIEFSDLLGFSFRADQQLSGNVDFCTQTRQQRQQVLHSLCEFYMRHLEYFKMPKSLAVLQEVLNPQPSSNPA